MVQSTHDVRLGPCKVVKRYRSWNLGEPDREWTGLSLLHRTAPGLAPEPLERRIDDGAPVVVMTRVPGVPLGSAPLGRKQLVALGRTLRRMYAAVPADELARIPERRSGPSELVSTLLAWIREPRPPVSAPIEDALGAGREWLDGSDVAVLAGPLAQQVFTQADGNLANFIWDGSRCYVVDFEDSGVSDPAYEVADLLEHVSVWLPGLIAADELVPVLGFSPEQEARLVGFRRLMAVYWLLMLLPDNPGYRRNPRGSLERQAHRTLALLHR